MDSVTNPFAAGLSVTPDCQGYHPIAVVADGGLLCEHCVVDASLPVIDRVGRIEAPLDDPADEQWAVVAWINSGDLDDATDRCDHCSRIWVGDL